MHAIICTRVVQIGVASFGHSVLPGGNPFLHDARANKNVHASNASRTTPRNPISNNNRLMLRRFGYSEVTRVAQCYQCHLRPD